METCVTMQAAEICKEKNKKNKKKICKTIFKPIWFSSSGQTYTTLYVLLNILKKHYNKYTVVTGISYFYYFGCFSFSDYQYCGY